jgi:hypothetical protein
LLGLTPILTAVSKTKRLQQKVQNIREGIRAFFPDAFKKENDETRDGKGAESLQGLAATKKFGSAIVENTGRCRGVFCLLHCFGNPTEIASDRKNKT